jgi:hypothetical protein
MRALALVLAVLLAGCAEPPRRAGPAPEPASSPGGRGWWGSAPPPAPVAPPSAVSSGKTGAAAPEHRPARWRARAGLTWQWQLTGELDLTVDADVYELDAFTTPADAVARLHAAGRRVICYVNAGAHEDFRPDAGRYPAALLGTANGWPGERWVDVRQWPQLEPVLRERLRMCREKGFDAVEADNVDGFTHDTGFGLTAADQLLFNRRVAALAHSLGLAAGLKNDLDQAAALQPWFDFAVNEECFRFGECAKLAPFTLAGKAVFHVEYEVPAARFCAQTRTLGLASMHKHPDLDAWRDHC